MINKLRLLLWKNFLQQKRQPIGTFIALVIPIGFSLLLVLVKDSQLTEEYVDHDSLELNLIIPCIFHKWINQTILYSPNSSEVTSIMTCFTLLYETKGFKNEKDLENYYVINSANVFAAVQLNVDVLNVSNIKVKIRFPSELKLYKKFGRFEDTWVTNLIYPMRHLAGQRIRDGGIGSIPNYYLEGFLTLQAMISNVVTNRQDVKRVCSRTNWNISQWLDFFYMGDISLKEFPMGKWSENGIEKFIDFLAGIVVLFSFAYFGFSITRCITLEKERQLKENMKIMGLSNSIHWTAWFLTYIIFLSIITIIMVLIFTTLDVFPRVNPLLAFLFFLLYISAVITQSFAVSTLFSRAIYASVFMVIWWFSSYYPFSVISYRKKEFFTVSLWKHLLSSLLPNTAMAFGCEIIFKYKGSHEGLQWFNMAEPPTPDDQLTFQHILILLFVDTFLYLFVALYVEAVFPGEYSIPLPWYFFLTRKYWCDSNKIGRSVKENINNVSLDAQNFEKDPENLKVGVRISNLKKAYKTGVVITISKLNLYENQITVLVGHNGAGKSTILSMLSGMIKSTSGTAIINGYDLITTLDKVRKSMGVCLQNNIIFDLLNVKEHLYFYCKLKCGMSDHDIDNEVEKYTKLLGLKKGSKGKSLSGGMKRRLSLAIALCAKSKIVLLDEPTSGLDPTTRRDLWNFLKIEKIGRTILLSTHFMDEADYLGDRIAIMADGELQCCGSPFFLKKNFANGYRLIIEKTSKCDTVKVTSLLRNFIPNIEISTNAGSDLCYVLPEEAAEKFENMLKALENDASKLDIKSFGISLNTLDEVFLKRGINIDSRRSNIESNKSSTVYSNLDENLDNKNFFVKNSNAQFLQIYALVLKRFLYLYRNRITLITCLFFMAFWMAFSLTFEQKNTYERLPPLVLTLSKFKNPVALINGSSAYSRTYKNLVKRFEVVDDLEDTIIDKSRLDHETVRRKYIIGATFGYKTRKERIVGYFSYFPYHAAPIALGYILNAISITKFGQEFTFINHPLPYIMKTKPKDFLKKNSIGFDIADNLAIAVTLLSTYCVLFYIKERSSQFKHLQFLAGARIDAFWLVAFIIDLFLFAFTTLSLVIVLLCFQEDGYKTAKEIGILISILFGFACSIFPMIYVSSHLFTVPSTGFVSIMFFGWFVASLIFFVIQIMSLPRSKYQDLAKILHDIFLFVPHYGLIVSLKDSNRMFLFNKICKSLLKTCSEQTEIKVDCENYLNISRSGQRCGEENFFKWERPGSGKNICFSLIMGTVLFMLHFLIEYNMFEKPLSMLDKFLQLHKDPPLSQDTDEDVQKEKQKIHDLSERELLANHTLVLKDVTKYYRRFLAVNSLCLGVNKNECFGLLGVNGAGKTTTFKMMTGDLRISAGNIWIDGSNLKSQLKTAQQKIGYCPQFNGLLEDLTPRQTLQIFALLHGASLNSSSIIAVTISKNFDFYKYLDKRVSQLSGGNRKKLSAAIALMGNPIVIFLDEPSTGMDVGTKRFLHNVLINARNEGKCIILTTHCIEECEVLCTRIAIMVNGEFKCLGSTQHLKGKFAAGYILSIRLNKGDNAQIVDTINIEEFVKSNFPSAKLNDKHEELLTYIITDSRMKLSRMFGILEKAKKQNPVIDDYYLGQGNLEQVFLTFTKYQR